MASDPVKETSGKVRVEAFSDAVIAIILTIMVLELKLPDALANGLDHAALMAVAPKFVAYAMSFLVLAIMWMNHRHLLDAVRQPSGGFLWLNNLLLFWMSLIPASTALLGEHPLAPTAAALYGANLTLSATTFTAMRVCLWRGERTDPALRQLHAAITGKSALGAAVYGASVPLAFLSVYAALACFIVVPAVFFIPEGRRKT